MTPYVIDNKKRQEYFLFLIFFTAISFLLGYFFGYQNAQSLNNEIIAVVKPVSVTAAKAGSDNMQNTEEKSKQKTDKDKAKPSVKNTKKTAKTDTKASKKNINKAKTKPKSMSKAKQKPKATKSEKSKKSVKRQVKSKPKIKPAVEKLKKSVVKKKAEPATKIITAAKSSQSTSDAVQGDKDLKVNNPDSVNNIHNDKSPQSVDNENKAPDKKVIGYSVQAGMFANKKNAEKYADKLKENGFEAFVVDFISSNGKQKYNVRFGRFSERINASSKMREYKQLFTTPAYIVINR